ncbi:2-hydroxyisoflavanone dehydratase-like [Typha angustifolia]|uniref:2-hydroxyisoflavanone dehydratase-like n=1 Tax=Typha angustifolia TaxID=59011 RepID=UPI003C2CAF72
MDPNGDGIIHDSVIRIYKSGRADRFLPTDFTPPSTDPVSGVSSKDVTISPELGIRARLYLPKIVADSNRKLPVLVYYHGGGFCLGSAFDSCMHNYLNSLVSKANVVSVSVEYRLAPEHPVPIPHDDSWVALRWVASHAKGGSEAWLADHADFDRLFVAGESAGANIAHHMAMRAGAEGVKVYGLVLIHPYFLGSKKVESEEFNPTMSTGLASLWKACAPEKGLDDPVINPTAEDAPDLVGLGCSRVLVCVGGKDVLRDKGREYYWKLKESGWNGEVKMWEAAAQGHAFHLFNSTCDEAMAQDKVIATFLNC